MFELNSYHLWTALVTPLSDDGSIDYKSLKKLVESQLEAKNGLLVLGSTGEAMSFSLEERKNILDYVIGLNVGLPIMVGVGGTNLLESMQWVQYLNGVQVDAYLMVTPLYSKPGFKGQLRWFETLLDCAERPCMLYNVPSRTGVSLHLEAVKELAGHARFWALKEASGSLEDYLKYQHAAGTSVRLYSGDDGMMPVFGKVGCAGCVSVASNVWPRETRQYVLDSLANRELDETWNYACKALFVATNPIPIKALLQETGILETATLRLPLSAEDLNEKQVLRAANSSIEQWYLHRMDQNIRLRHQDKSVGYRIVELQESEIETEIKSDSRNQNPLTVVTES